jgi:hypothetical protein
VRDNFAIWILDFDGPVAVDCDAFVVSTGPPFGW